MEHYYVPIQFNLTDDSLFSVRWVGDQYYVFDGCPDRTQEISLDYIGVTSWGFSSDIGTTNIPLDSKLSVGEGCDSSEYDIATVVSSRSILDAPNFAPYEPFYFLGFVFASLIIFIAAVKLIFGWGWK